MSSPSAETHNPKLIHQCIELSNCSSQLVAAKVDIDPTTGLPIADGAEWHRSKDELWSVPVLVKDILGNYVAVLDRKRQEGVGGLEVPSLLNSIGMVSNWSRGTIRVAATGLNQTCFYFICNKRLPLIQVEDLEIKVGDRVFHPKQGDGNQTCTDISCPLQPFRATSPQLNEFGSFQVSDSLASALRSAKPGQVWIKLRLLSGGFPTVQTVNDKTIQAWQTIYKDADPSILSSMNPPDFKIVPIHNWPESTEKETIGTTKYSRPVANTSKQVAEQSTPLQDNQTNLPIVRGTTWRSGNNIPWSVPVLVRDDFEGEYKAVFDKSSGLITNWSQQFMEVFLYDKQQGYIFNVQAFDLQLGSQTFKLEGSQNRFVISQDLSKALREAPAIKPVLTFTIQRSKKKPKSIQRTLDLETVQAWKTLYKAEGLATSSTK
ncbi:MAG TPA: hypothetical protein V6D19_01485 [Stenomitos sp.]